MSRIETIGNATLYLGDCLDVLKTLPTNSVDSVVCDPPYGLSFMGKKWDYDVPSVEIWAECLRVLKPGGHLLAFAGTRTQHRMAVRIEDAGFEIRDMIAWVYGSGFPKSLDVSKAIDKAAGAEREVLGTVDPRGAFDGRERKSAAINTNWRGAEGRDDVRDLSKKDVTAPATEAARQWQGWGTALKPALEPITMARKPLVGTVAANVLEHGTGALNIDGCRVGDFQNTTPSGVDRRNAALAEAGYRPGTYQMGDKTPDTPPGRWPANLIHDGSDDVVALFPNSDSPWIGNNNSGAKGGRMFGGGQQSVSEKPEYRDAGSAARFFYCAKASKADREEGLGGAPDRVLAMSNQAKAELARGNMHEGESGMNTAKVRKNHHPTVKPTDLMAYLCRLVTPPGGVVLDPFMGSGSTGKAAIPEGFHFIGVECEPAYFDIAVRRIDQAHAQGQLFEPTQAAPVQLGLEAA